MTLACACTCICTSRRSPLTITVAITASTQSGTHFAGSLSRFFSSPSSDGSGACACTRGAKLEANSARNKPAAAVDRQGGRRQFVGHSVGEIDQRQQQCCRREHSEDAPHRQEQRRNDGETNRLLFVDRSAPAQLISEIRPVRNAGAGLQHRVGRVALQALGRGQSARTPSELAAPRWRDAPRLRLLLDGPAAGSLHPAPPPQWSSPAQSRSVAQHSHTAATCISCGRRANRYCCTANAISTNASATSERN